MTTPDADLLPAGAVVADRFEIVRKLNEGGVGVVYLAMQRGLERPVALKVLHPSFVDDPVISKRFEKEARAISQLAHPHVVTLFDFGRLPQGGLYLAMEYLEGESLREKLDRDGPFVQARALHVVRQIALALVAAHGARIVHRDLKPENVMLIDRSRDADFAKVLDFGLARDIGGDARDMTTKQNTVAGTPAYMPPERVEGVHDDARSDLYSLGALWFELLAGRPPFVADDALQVVFQHVRNRAPLVSSIVPAVDEGTSALIDRLLAKRPEERPASAAALLEEMRHARDTAPIALVQRKTQPPTPAPSFARDAALPEVTQEVEVHLLTKSKRSLEQSPSELIRATLESMRATPARADAVRACAKGLGSWLDRVCVYSFGDDDPHLLASVRIPDLDALSHAVKGHPALQAARTHPFGLYDAARTAPSWLAFYKALGGQLPGGVLLGAHPTPSGAILIYGDHRAVDLAEGVSGDDVAALAAAIAAAHGLH